MAKTATVGADECVYGGGHLPPLIYQPPGSELRCGMDWPGTWNSGHPVTRPGYERPCRICRKPATLTDCRGRPCHKVCAEAEFLTGHLTAAP